MDAVFTLLGGLGLFLFGMDEMSKGIQRLAGDRLKGLLRTLAANRFLGVFSGTVATAVVQTSTVTTVMIVGFVNAGLISLPQAISMILGAHIGTTVTAQIVAFNIGYIGLPLIALGATIHFFSRSDIFRNSGGVIFGFGSIFFGLKLMTDIFISQSDNPFLQTLLSSVGTHPIFGLLIGIGITILVHSSGIMSGVVIALALSSVISFQEAIPFILGENIGTTITANLTAIGGSYAAKQAARAHFIVNATGAALAFIFLQPFMRFVLALSPAGNVARQIANAHTIFNVLTTILFLPFIAVVARMTELLIIGKKEQAELAYLEEASLEDPGTAFDQVRRALAEATGHAGQFLKMLSFALAQGSEKDIGEMKKISQRISRYQSRITEYLEKIPSKNISKTESHFLPRLVRIVHEIERVHDYELKLREVLTRMVGEGRKFHPIESREIKAYFADVLRLMEKTKSLFENKIKSRAEKIHDSYEAIYATKEALRAKSRRRFESGRTKIATANYYYDVISSLEEIARKCRNIAKALVE